MTITSHSNPQLAELRRLASRRDSRRRSGLFVAEGEDLLAAADAAGWRPLRRYCAAGSGLEGMEVDPRLLAAACGLGSGTRAVAVYRERWAPAPAGPLCVHLHGVADPGNVGTILRGAEAFAASAVSIGPGCADPFSPRAVRASMGAVFTVPLVRTTGSPAQREAGLPAQREAGSAAQREARLPAQLAIGSLAQLPRPILALCAGRGVPLAEVGLRPGTLLIGSERHGLPEELIAAADLVARIPVANHSLNAAMAATVALYEANRMAAQ